MKIVKELPPEEYRRAQDCVTTLHETQMSRPDFRLRMAKQRLMERGFGSRWRLKPTSRRRCNVIQNGIHTALQGRLIDHVTWWAPAFSSGLPTLVLVTQPYGAFTPEDELALSAVGCALVDLNTWAFYYPFYPKHASCFAIVADVQSQNQMLRPPRSTSEADFIFGSRHVETEETEEL